MSDSKPKVELTPMPQLDGLRALCLLSIIIHHWTVNAVHLPFPFEIGAFVFFALSGYLITRILLRAKNKWQTGDATFGYILKSFTMRRILRLIPAYLVAILLYTIILTPDVLKNFLWYITNTSNIHFALQGSWQGGADQFWTLAVDQQFYALWPFLILLSPKKLLPILLIALAALSPLSRHLAHYDLALFTGDKHDKLPWFLTDHLCFGALLAVCHEAGRLPKKIFFWSGLLISLLLYLLLRYDAVQFPLSSLFQQTVLAAFSTCLVGICIQGMSGLGKTILEHPKVQYLGKRSYGYYLYHNLAILLLGKIAFFLFPGPESKDYFLLLRLILASGILYALTHYSWKYIEEPLILLKNKHRYQK